MIFPLEELVKYKDSIYEITCAATHRAVQIAKLVKGEHDLHIEGEYSELLKQSNDKVVSLGARQLFTKEVRYRIE